MSSEFSLDQLSKIKKMEFNLAAWAACARELNLPEILKEDLQKAVLMLGGLRLILLSAVMTTSDKAVAVKYEYNNGDDAG